MGLKHTQFSLAHAPEQADFALELAEALTELGDMILEKNRKYGDSALRSNPIVGVSAAIKVRMLDKMRRIESGQPDDGEDVWQDLFGYGALLRVALKREASQPRSAASLSPEAFITSHKGEVKVVTAWSQDELLEKTAGEIVLYANHREVRPDLGSPRQYYAYVKVPAFGEVAHPEDQYPAWCFSDYVEM